jgi:hypothetical protein
MARELLSAADRRASRVTTDKQTGDDYDSPWKEALEDYLEPFLALFFPEIHTAIDWRRAPEFLDKELQKVVRQAELGRSEVDKVVKVWRLDGEETWVLLHVEVQAQPQAHHFQLRMYVYNYRLFDRYGRTVVSLAVLADDRPGWRPESFVSELWGCRASLCFPAVKLLDYTERWDELASSQNPFATVVMAHLKAQKTKQDLKERLRWKIWLHHRLYGLGYTRDDIIKLSRLIDWLMALPEELEQAFAVELAELEEEHKMPYVHSVERLGIKKGKQEGLRESVISALEVRFGIVPEPVKEALQAVSDHDLLSELHRQAVIVPSLEGFEAVLRELQPSDD